MSYHSFILEAIKIKNKENTNNDDQQKNHLRIKLDGPIVG